MGSRSEGNQTQGHILCGFIDMKCLEQADPQTESRLVITRGGRNWVSSQDDETVPKVLIQGVPWWISGQNSVLPLPWAWVQFLVWGIKFPQVAQCGQKKVLTQTPDAVLLGQDLTPAID